MSARDAREIDHIILYEIRGGGDLSSMVGNLNMV